MNLWLLFDYLLYFRLMLIRFFKSNQPATLFAVPVIVLLLWIEGFMHQSPLPTSDAMPIYKLILLYYSPRTAIIYKIIALGLLIFQAIYLNNIINKHEVLFKRSYLPALLYVALMSLFIPFLNLHPIILVNTLLIVLLDKILSFYKTTSLITVFQCGLLLGVGSLIYFPSIMLYISLLIGLAILRPYNWRDWIASVIGLTLPYYFLSAWYFYFDTLENFWKIKIPGYFIHLIRFDFTLTNPMKALMATLGATLLLSLFKLQSNSYRNTIKSRNFQVVILFLLIFSGASFLLSPRLYLEHFCIIAIPLSIFTSYFFLSVKKTFWVEILMFIIIGLLVYNQVIYRG